MNPKSSIKDENLPRDENGKDVWIRREIGYPMDMGLMLQN